MNPRPLRRLITAGILCFICSTAVYAQSRCLVGDDLTAATGWLQIVPHPPIFWGVRFATIRFTQDLNPSAPMRSVIQDAAIQWNLRACDTGIFFIPFNSSLGHVFADIDFVQLSADSDLTLGCIAYVPHDGTAPTYDINYGPNFMSRLSTLPREQNVSAVMHELGHVLGLDESNPPLSPTIMTQPAGCSSPMAVTTLSNADALKVAECTNSSPACQWPFFFPIGPELCVQEGAHWNYSVGVCSPEPEPVPCEDCINNDDCCNGDVCHEGQCGAPYVYCDCPPDTVCYDGLCSYATPILIDVNGDGFQLTDAEGGVDFDFEGDGVPRRMAWTAAGADDAWLVLDRNRNGRIDSAREMFGNLSPQPVIPLEDRNGFLALAEFDNSTLGGNGDGEISRQDYYFGGLRLWIDSNHNGISEAAELTSLETTGLAVLELKYKESRRRDQYGNWFRYRAKVKDSHGAQVGRWAWDVILRLN